MSEGRETRRPSRRCTTSMWKIVSWLTNELPDARFTGPNRNLLADILLVYQKRSCKMPVFPTQIRILGLHRLL